MLCFLLFQIWATRYVVSMHHTFSSWNLLTSSAQSFSKFLKNILNDSYIFIFIICSKLQILNSITIFIILGLTLIEIIGDPYLIIDCNSMPCLLYTSRCSLEKQLHKKKKPLHQDTRKARNESPSWLAVMQPATTSLGWL